MVTKITYTDGITVGQFAEKLNRNSSDIIKLLFMLGKMVTINTNLDEETIQLICMEYNVDATKEIIVDP
ncbi:MAG: translation initiation factor IF-2 N-terminal domain-containing protein, partial [Erysipelotrichaceae bacterium]